MMSWKSDKKILTEIFNDHYINIVEKSSGTKPSSLGVIHLVRTQNFPKN